MSVHVDPPSPRDERLRHPPAPGPTEIAAGREASTPQPTSGEAGPTPPCPSDAHPPVSATRLLVLSSPGSPPGIAGPGAASDAASATAPPAAAAGVPIPFGEYVLLAELGRGGMGVVHRARHVRLDRVVALKRIQSGRLASAEEVRRFLAEARAAAALDHPGIVPVYDAGEHEGQPFFTMAYVEGTDLADRIARGGPLAAPEAADLARRIAEAVAFAHARGVVHRDLKPANVLLDAEGRPRITDFGLAKRAADPGGLTASGAVVGTPAYMSPEQAAGAQVGPRSDVYALGALLYSLLTGRPPHQSASPLDVLRRVLEEEPIPPRTFDPAIPADLETVCLQAMRKEPAARYPDAAAMARDLARFLAGEPIVARPAGRLERAWKWARRRPAVAALGLALLVVAALGVGGVIGQWSHAERLLYYHRIALAEREWQAGETERAVELLDGCRVLHRGWEWRFLRRLCHPERAGLNPGGWFPNGIQVSPDGRRVAVESSNLRVAVLDLESGERQVEFPGLVRAGGTFLDQGRRLAAIPREGARVVALDLSGGTVADLPFPGLEEPQEVVASADGTRLAVADARGVSILDLPSGRVFGPHPGPARHVRLDRAGTVVAFLSGRSAVALDVETGRERARCDPARALRLDLAPQGDRLAWIELLPDTEDHAARAVLHLWDLAAAREISATPLSGRTWDGLRFSREGTRLAAIRDGKRVTAWDAATGAEVAVCRPIRTRAHDLAFLPGEREVILASTTLLVLSIEPEPAPAPLRLAGHEQRVWRVARSPDGRRLASASVDGTIRLWDAADGKPAGVLRGHGHPVSAIAFSPDGASLLSCAGPYGREGPQRDGQVVTVWVQGVSQGRLEEVKLWDLPSGGERRSFPGGGGTVLALAFAPGGEIVAACREDGTLERWDLVSGRRTVLWQDAAHPPAEADFSADGKAIVTVHSPHHVRWSDAGSGATRWLQPIAGASLQGAAVSPDASRVAVAHDDGSVTLLDAGSGAIVVTLRPEAAARPLAVRLSWPEAGGQISPFLLRFTWARWEDGGRVLSTASTEDVPAMPLLTGWVRRWDGSELPASFLRRDDRAAWAGPIVVGGLALLWWLALGYGVAAAWRGYEAARRRASRGAIAAAAGTQVVSGLFAAGGAIWLGAYVSPKLPYLNADPLVALAAQALGAVLGLGLAAASSWADTRLVRRRERSAGSGGANPPA